ncbi:MAG: HD domain-containing phosphohydrolase [Spirochaetota bacterium]
MTTATGPITGRKRILCVDDEEPNLVLVDAILRPRGYEIVIARTGEEALAKMVEQPIDLILLDVMLPLIDGFDVCRILKADDRFRKIPVILITSLNSREDRIAGMEAGAEDFISKPIEQLELLARIGMLLKVRRLDRQVENAFAGVRELTSFSRQLLAGYDPLAFDFQTYVEKLTHRLLKPESGGLDSASEIVISFRDSEGTKNLVFRRTGESVIGSRFSGSLVHGFFPRNKPEIGFVNEEELESHEWKMVKDTLVHTSIKPRNLVYFHDEELTVLSVGYREEATAHNATVVENLVVLIKFLKSLSHQVEETEDAFIYTMKTLARAAEVNDDDTGNHILRVGKYAAALAEELGHGRDFVYKMQMQGAMHDVGKIHTPPSILKKPSSLTPEEMVVVKQHPLKGGQILGDHPRLAMAKVIAISHHERWDGTGYPGGLSGEEIPIEGRILSLADQYDALRNKRVYKAAFDHEKASAIIATGDGRTRPEHFDPAVLGAFRRVMGGFEKIYHELRDF